MKVLALIEGPNCVCYRYRIEAYAWALAARGLRLEVVPLERGALRRIGQLRAARRADLVILQRKLLPPWQLAILRRAARRLVYDVDDSLFQRNSYNRKGPTSWVRQAHFWATVYASDAVTVGNEHLKERAAAYVGPERVHVVPTCVDPKLYPMARHRRAGAAAKLVWIGQQSTLRSLGRAKRQLAAAAGRLPGLELRVICDRFPELPGVRVMPYRWSAATETTALAEADIGINWLPDDAWSRGKCGLRVLQYMAAGLPVVANPVGMNCEMVLHGRTGLLASTPAHWAAAIERLAGNPALRQEMGQAGRQLVEQRFSVAGWGPEFARLIERVARGRQWAVGSDQWSVVSDQWSVGSEQRAVGSEQRAVGSEQRAVGSRQRSAVSGQPPAVSTHCPLR